MLSKQPALRALSVALLLLWGCADVPTDSEPSASEEAQFAEAEPSAPAVSEQELGLAAPLLTCGGFLGTPCPGNRRCVDDPRDDCDPKHGGADCSGICVCRPTHTCPVGSVFDPRSCGCRRDPPVCPRNPCAFTTCVVGSTCEVSAKCEATCVPQSPCPVCPPGRVCPLFCPAPAI